MSPFDVVIGLALLVAAFVVPVVTIARASRKTPPPLVLQQGAPLGLRCSVATCSERAPWVIKGWPLCTDHAAPIIERRDAS